MIYLAWSVREVQIVSDWTNKETSWFGVTHGVSVAARMFTIYSITDAYNYNLTVDYWFCFHGRGRCYLSALPCGSYAYIRERINIQEEGEIHVGTCLCFVRIVCTVTTCWLFLFHCSVGTRPLKFSSDSFCRNKFTLWWVGWRVRPLHRNKGGVGEVFYRSSKYKLGTFFLSLSLSLF
jgi:hypothetical protein